MFGFRPKLPISDEDRLWVDGGFDRLSCMLGRERMLQARVVLPDAEHFPDPYDKKRVLRRKNVSPDLRLHAGRPQLD